MIITNNPGFWRDKLNAPLLERIGAAPTELVDYVTMVNASVGSSVATIPAIAPSGLLADVREAIATMPSAVTSLLPGVLLGVFFAHDLGSSAVTDIVVDADGNVVGTVVALDLDALLLRRANEWATWKENMPFFQSGALTLDVCIAEPEQNTRTGAIQFLLLHEFGHVLTAGNRFLPDWWQAPELIGGTGDYSFLPFAWQIREDKRIVPQAEDDFPGRDRVRYYGDAQLDAEHMLAVYDSLQRSTFATLYASTNAYDDFAESFATYVHCVLMGRPWRAQIFADGHLQMTSENFWHSPRSAPKRAFMERLLAAA